MNVAHRLTVALCICCLAFSAEAQTYKPNWKSIDSRPIPAWFEDAKFGIFIHWGVFSVPAWAPSGEEDVYSQYAEWYWRRLSEDTSAVGRQFNDFHTKTFGKDFKYQDFANQFKCELFDPGQWADVLANSGAKYVVLTSKHHEGFTLWPSKESWNWNAVDIGPHRDILGDLTKAVKNKGLKMGYYYSLYEWFNPLYKADLNAYVSQHMFPQMKDLVTRYKPDVFWTDGEWDHPSEKWRSTEFLAWLYNDSPVKKDVVVNDRWGAETRSKHGGFYTTEYDRVHDENTIGKKIAHPWEECRGIGNSFGYNRNEDLADYSTSQALINILVDKVARGGNLLLNIGPTADGRIPVIMQQRLKDTGDWLRVNGDGIYGTRVWDKAPVPGKETTVFYTRKGNDLYVICTKWPAQKLDVKGVKKAAVSLLGYKGKVSSSSSGGSLSIQPPAITPADGLNPYAWVFKLEGAL